MYALILLKFSEPAKNNIFWHVFFHAVSFSKFSITTFATHCRASVTHMLDLCIRGMSIRPSVCPLQAGIDSKLMTVGSCGFHRRLAQRIQLLRPKCIIGHKETPHP